MVLARVVGPIWGARHAASLTGQKILELVTAQGQTLCAVDALGAGPGEWVLVAHGSRVRDLTVGAELAEKDIVVAIVDGVQDADDAGAIEQSRLSPRFVAGAARGAS